VLRVMAELAPQIARITAERVQLELNKLLLGAHPRRGLEVLVETGLAAFVLPEVAALQMTTDEHGQHKDVYAHTLQVLEQAIALEGVGGPDLVLRWAALLHDIGKPDTRRFATGGVTFHHHEVVGARMAKARLKALKFPKDDIEDISRLVFLHLRFYGYGRGEWTDSAVRRYVTDAGPLLERLHRLVRSDTTTRNKRKAAALSATYDHLEERIARLREQEELDAIRPDLDGTQIMEILQIGPGPLVGRAYKHLLELRMEQGPLDRDQAVAELKQWYAANAG
jgi:poly(A) polymerase